MRIKNLAGPALSGVLGLYFIVMHRYQANMGGCGLTLPLNILSWIAMLSIVLLAVLSETGRAARPVSRQGQLMTAAVLLMTLPLSEKITQFQRYDFDQHSALLIDYNRSRNPRDLQRYLAWSQRYLQVWQDAGVYDAAIRIARFEGKRREATALAIRAQRAFPGDRRFRHADQGGGRRERD